MNPKLEDSTNPFLLYLIDQSNKKEEYEDELSDPKTMNLIFNTYIKDITRMLITHHVFDSSGDKQMNMEKDMSALNPRNHSIPEVKNQMKSKVQEISPKIGK